ncbi:MAG TPA: apolipoprotein N-acyltransferase [Verrucomicrobiae bacterium]|nr:apolipoprotein N-acyltransferase [Verrucomicrobiae bacterium]
MKPISRYFLAALGGIILSLAYPNFGVAGLGWIGPGIILFSGYGAGGKLAFRFAFCGGLTHFAISLCWLLAIPYTFYGVPLAPGLGWLALSAYCGLYVAVWGWFCWKIFPGMGRTLWALSCAAAWVGLEVWRGWFLSGFPWNFLGASQFRMLPVIQIASFTGIYGVSFLMVWLSVSLGLLVLARTRQSIWTTAGLPLIAVVIIGAWGATQTATIAPAARELKVALVQPSFPQTLIWDPNGDAARFEQVMALSRQALAAEPDMLIWPESGAPDMTPENQAALGRLLSQHKASMVFCVDSTGTTPDGKEAVYNSSLLLDATGRVQGIYHKRRLVMFGEYVPLLRWLPFLKFLAPIGSGFTPGRDAVQFETSAPRAKTSVLICFEDVFPGEARAHVAADTDFLINLTNDGWFGKGAAQWQQTAGAVFRAVENNLPLVRCSNNGVTCWIDGKGRLREVLQTPDKIYGAGVMSATLPLQGDRRVPTFYNRHGDCFAWGCAGVAALAFLRARRRNTEENLSVPR